MSRVFVRPAGPDRKVMLLKHPGQYVPAAGMEMENDRYVQRCIARGDLVIAPPPAPAAKPAATPATASTPTPAAAPAAAQPSAAASTSTAAAKKD